MSLQSWKSEFYPERTVDAEEVSPYYRYEDPEFMIDALKATLADLTK